MHLSRSALVRRSWRLHHHLPRRTFASTASRRQNIIDASNAEVNSARAYCSNLLKQYDSPSYTLQPFIPHLARDAYLAIRAFNVDVARVADVTSHSTVAAFRMQFWRDTIARALSGSPPKEPVAILLAKAAESLYEQSQGKSRLSKNWFMRVIDAREKHMGNAPYPSISALESYAESTYSTLLYLTLSALPMASVTADHLASHIGKASGIAAVLRGLPLIAFPTPHNHHNPTNTKTQRNPGAPRQGVVLLPLDIMANCGVVEEDVLRKGASASGLRDAVFEVATRANDHLITAREMLKNLRAGQDVGHEFEHMDDEERLYSTQQSIGGSASLKDDVDRAFGVLIPAVATSMWLEKLQKVDFDVFDAKLRTTDWKLPLRAYWAYSRKQL